VRAPLSRKNSSLGTKRKQDLFQPGGWLDLAPRVPLAQVPVCRLFQIPYFSCFYSGKDIASSLLKSFFQSSPRNIHRV
jgi:hypothetical protein